MWSTHLVSTTDIFQYFVITHGVHISQLIQPVCSLDTNEALGKRNWSKSPVKVEQALVEVNVEELSNIKIVW